MAEMDLIQPKPLPWVILALTPIGVVRGQTWKVALFGMKLKVLKRSGTFYDFNLSHSPPASTPPLNGVIRGQSVNKAIFFHLTIKQVLGL